jgi:hypothetical protein
MKLKYRQIHLDFHNSPLIYNIGENFEPEKFAEIMKKANVNSVTFFAKCHHGMSYYKTKVGKMHPALKKDLLSLAVEYLHKEGIDCIAYISVGWDEYIAYENPDYIEITPEGKLSTSFLESRWKKICLNNRKYIEYLHKQTEEILKNYNVDGIFFDIVFQNECVCKRCVYDMIEKGLNPEVNEDRIKFKKIVEYNFLRETFEFVKRIRPDVKIFFNSRLRIGMEEEFDFYTHFEIESLPTGGWGYNHFPIMAKYFQTQNKDFLGMTARFHLSWADFGGIKNKEGLEYEIFTIIANGGKCSIGDQMNPDGTLEEEVYDLIGSVYGKVKKIENYYERVKPYAEIGVLSFKEPSGEKYDAIEGTARILLETHNQFQIITEDNDFRKYKLLILPDYYLIGEKLKKKIDDYLKEGGKIILSYDSGISENENKFAIDLPLKFIEKSKFIPDYFKFIVDLPYKSKYVMYNPGNIVECEKGKVIAKIIKPYFNRNWRHFSSHFQTPYEEETDYPAIILGNNFAYIWAPIFSTYINYGYWIYREIVDYLIKNLIERKIEVKNLPPNAYLYYSEGENSGIISIIYYPHQRLNRRIDVIYSEGIAENLEVLLNDKKIENIEKLYGEGEVEIEKNKIKIKKVKGFSSILVNFK